MNMNVSILDKLIQVTGAQAALACIPHRPTAVVVRVTRPSGEIRNTILPQPQVWLGKSCLLVNTVHGWVTAAAVEPLTDPGQELEVIPTRQYINAKCPYTTSDDGAIEEAVKSVWELMENTQRVNDEKKRFRAMMARPKSRAKLIEEWVNRKGDEASRRFKAWHGMMDSMLAIARRAEQTGAFDLEWSTRFKAQIAFRKEFADAREAKDVNGCRRALRNMKRNAKILAEAPWLLAETLAKAPDPADFEPFDAEAEMAALREEARYQWGA